MIRFVANCFYIILALLFSFFQSFNIFFFMFFYNFFFSFVEIVSWHYEKSNTDVEMLTIQTFDFVFCFSGHFSDCFFVPFFVLCRFTRITTHSCYTVGYFAWGSLNTVLRHVRTYNGENNNQLKKPKLTN